MYEDKANMMMDGTWELEVGKRSNLPLGRGCASFEAVSGENEERRIMKSLLDVIVVGLCQG